MASLLESFTGQHRDIAHVEFRTMLNRAIEMQGAEALRCSKRDAAVHEAGHVVVDHVEGEQLHSARIWKEVDGWTGHTNAGEKWEIKPHTPVEHDLRRGRIVIAGWMAELLEQGDRMAQASSLDEIIFFRQINANSAWKMGYTHDAAQGIAIDQMVAVAETLSARWQAVDAIARALERRERLNGTQLKTMARRQKAAQAAA